MSEGYHEELENKKAVDNKAGQNKIDDIRQRYVSLHKAFPSQELFLDFCFRLRIYLPFNKTVMPLQHYYIIKQKFVNTFFTKTAVKPK